jgi:hypothetical protein
VGQHIGEDRQGIGLNWLEGPVTHYSAHDVPPNS